MKKHQYDWEKENLIDIEDQQFMYYFQKKTKKKLQEHKKKSENSFIEFKEKLNEIECDYKNAIKKIGKIQNDSFIRR